jgi:hypothetical protein
MTEGPDGPGHPASPRLPGAADARRPPERRCSEGRPADGAGDQPPSVAAADLIAVAKVLTSV